MDYLAALARYSERSMRSVIERMLVKTPPPADCPDCIEAHDRLMQVHGALSLIAEERRAEMREARLRQPDTGNSIARQDVTAGQLLVDAGLVSEARASVALDGETQSFDTGVVTVEPAIYDQAEEVADTSADIPPDLDIARARVMYDDPRTPAHLKPRLKERLEACLHKRYKTIGGGLRFCSDCKRTRNGYGEWSTL
jgi:hypothetical protein